MVENVGGIFFTVDADTGELIASIKQVDTQSNKLETRLKKLDVAVSKVVVGMKKAAIAVTAGAAAIAAVVKVSAAAAKEIGILASQSGVGVQEFQALTAAAKTVGIEQDKLGDIFKDSQDKVGDFLATGGGELKDFFETIAPQIGLTAEEFRNLSGPQILGKFQQALDGANLSASEQIFFLESLADEASRLRPLLSNNSEELRKQTDRFDDLNLALSQVEIDNLVELDKKFAQLGTTISKNTSIAISLFSEELNDLLIDAAEGAGILAKALPAVFGKFRDVSALQTIEQVREELRLTKDQIDNFEGVNPIGLLFGQTGDVLIAKFEARLAELNARMVQIREGAENTPVEVQVIPTINVGDSALAFQLAFEDALGSVQLTAEEAALEINEGINSIGLTGQQAAAQFGESMGASLASVGEGLADVAARAIVFNESFSEGAKKVAQTFLTEVLSSLIQVGARILINQAIASAGTAKATAESVASNATIASSAAPAAALTTLATVGSNVPIALAGIAAVTALAIGASGRQQGGPVAAGRAFRVNEGGGPEVFTEGGRQFLIPNANGQVVSNADATGGGGPTQVNINVTNNAQARVDVGRVTQNGGELTVDVIVADISSGNGPVSRALSENTNLTRKAR